MYVVFCMYICDSEHICSVCARYVLVYVCERKLLGLCVIVTLCTPSSVPYNTLRSYYWNSYFFWTFICHHNHINSVSDCVCSSLIQEN